jgi:hypothetical protein
MSLQKSFYIAVGVLQPAGQMSVDILAFPGFGGRSMQRQTGPRLQ